MGEQQMSERIGDVVVFCPEPDGVCELCGKVEELRPYGPGGKRVCFDCGMKDEPNARRIMDRILFGKADA